MTKKGHDDHNAAVATTVARRPFAHFGKVEAVTLPVPSQGGLAGRSSIVARTCPGIVAQTAISRALLGAEEVKISSVAQVAISDALLVGQDLDLEGVFVGSGPQTREPFFVTVTL